VSRTPRTEKVNVKVKVVCVKDVLGLLDGACSGRTSCEVSVRSLVDLHPCQKDFVSYLEAGYDCAEGRYFIHALRFLPSRLSRCICSASHG